MEEIINKPAHIAIIMDGNRRWATEQGLDKKLGHKKGEEVLENIVKYCNSIGLEYLTVFAFSTENWNRAKEEVDYLMMLLNMALDKFIKKLDDDIKIQLIGRRDNLDPKLLKKIEQIEEKTKDNKGLNLMIAFNYGGRDEITRATQKIAQRIKSGEIDVDDINEELISNSLDTAGKKDPDLVVRTSGELRVSNFLTWESTYSEFLFVDKYWPEFTEADIDYCIKEYSTRKRRKGK